MNKSMDVLNAIGSEIEYEIMVLALQELVMLMKNMTLLCLTIR